ncbi:MAG TPA: tetratricopeptide repeat protein [Thermoanaerobaculia bacterium]|nr:tetratricopeptide repeat protein [Thermoanaerobaculia bacterium]
MAFFRKDPQQVAEKLVAKGRIEAAIKEYKKVLDKDPEDPTILNRIGDLYVRLRKSSEAADYYQQTAQQYATDGFYVKAIAVYKKIHRIEPSRHEVLLRLAELYERQGLINDARAHYTQLAEYYTRQEDHRSAVETYQRIVELEPENPGHRLKLADAYRQLGRLDETLRVYLDLGRLMVKHGRADHAVQVYERAIELVPEDVGFVREAVSVLKQAGELDAANALIATAEVVHPEEASHLRALLETEAEPETAPEPEAEEEVVEVELEAEEEGLEGWQAVPDAMVGIGRDAGETRAPFGDTDDLEHDESASSAGVGSTAHRIESVDDVPEDGLWEISGSWSFADASSEEVEIELDPLEGLSTSAPPAASAEPPRVPDPAAAEPAAPAAAAAAADTGDRRRLDRENDLIAEADVFIKYGLSQKAVERLDELLALNPENMGGIDRLLAARIERAEEQAVIDLARRVSSGELGSGGSWRRFEGQLAEAGYRIEGDRLLAIDTGARPSGASEQVAAEPNFVEWAEDEDSEPVAAAEAGSSDPAAPSEADLVAPAAREFGSDGSERLADSDLLDSRPGELVASSWLEEDPASDENGGGRIFEEERQFFDLANELRPELEKEVGDAVERADEQSIDEIVEGFKRGVAENIAEEDSDTHYNLGIAYLEMMLIDEAIGEFQIAAKSPDHRADACAMLGQCYREKGMSDLAVKWYQRALEISNLENAQRAGVLYELGQTFEAMDDRESAYYTYLELRGVDSSFRDVRERIEALQ